MRQCAGMTPNRRALASARRPCERYNGGNLAREWCVVVGALSSEAARDLGRSLTGDGFDIEVEKSRARV